MSHKEKPLYKTVLHFVPILVVISAFSSIYIVYQIQPYGNLLISYDNQDAKNINVTVNYEPQSNNDFYVYSVKSFTLEDARNLASAFFSKVNDDVDFELESKEDNMYFIDSLDGKFHFSMELDSGMYNFHNSDYFQVDSEKPNTAYSEEQVRNMLNDFSIVLPKDCDFKIDDGIGYEFYSNMKTSNENVSYGTMYCTMFSNNILGRVDNRMVNLNEYDKVIAKSLNEAVEQIRKGNFNFDDKIPNNSDIVIENCETIYLCDSKKYYQPVYKFEAILCSDNANEDEDIDIFIPVM